MLTSHRAQMRRVVIVSAAFAAAGAVACGDPTSVSPETREAVVRAYLYAGQPVNDIKLTWTAPIGTPDSLADSASPPINSATVTLIKSGVRYLLSKSPGDTGYYRYTGTNLTVKEGDAFDFEAIVEGKTITAHTVVPTKPSDARMSSSTLKVPTFTFSPGAPRPDLSGLNAQVRWTRTTGALYFVTFESTDAVPVAIDLGLPPGFGGAIGMLRRRFISAPTAADSLSVNALSLSYYGNYTVRVWRVNEEYAQLYATLQQDSRDLNEPATNIHGGLGVFSAFAADTTLMVVVKQ